MQPSNKERGSIAELEFSLEALKRGYIVSLPFGDSAKYDLIIDKHGRFYRVQVKSTHVPIAKDGSFQISVGHGKSSKSSYTEGCCDLIACYVSSLKLFYIFPVKVLSEQKTLRVFPFSETSKHKHFKSNWDF